MAKEKQIKQEYINIAYQILAEEGYEAVTVRRLAKETGRNTASLYYYFDSLSYLISIASVRYLMHYDTLSNVIDQHYKALEVDLQSWVCLAWYAFHNVPIYENFFLYDIELSEKALYEYLELFPEERSLIDNYFMNNILLSLDIKAKCCS